MPFQEKSFDPNQCSVGTTDCHRMEFPCIKCTYDASCLYGETSNASCEVKTNVECQGARQFNRLIVKWSI